MDTDPRKWGFKVSGPFGPPYGSFLAALSFYNLLNAVEFNSCHILADLIFVSYAALYSEQALFSHDR